MKKKLVLLGLMLFLGLSFAFGQNKQITGTVTSSEDGLGFPGVSVVVKGTSIGISTDINGKFTLMAPADATTLVFTFVGMKQQEVAITGNVINVVMESETKQLDEVVVTGYSVRKKDVVASAVVVVNGESLKQMVPSTTFDNMLQGKAAGVEVTALNGKPGQTASVKIRGAISLNTLNGDKSQPLYVVDGVFMDEDNLGAINPGDIESMSVLKDASAASIYGSRGANGVVVLTTKKGKMGEGNIEYSVRYGTASKTKDNFTMMNAAQLIEYQEAANGGPIWTDPEKALLLSYDHNWEDDILRSAKIVSHSVSASGGNDNSTYFLSGSYDKNTGIVDGIDGFSRYSARLNLNTNVKKNLKVGITTTASRSSSDEIRDRNNVQNPINGIYTYMPYEPVYERDASGQVVKDNLGNPVFNLTSQGYQILEAMDKNPAWNYNTNFLGSAFADLKIFEGFNFLSKFSGTLLHFKGDSYMMPTSILQGYVGDPSAPGDKQDLGNDTYAYSWLNQFTYNKSFGSHNINASAFTEYNMGGFHSYLLRSKGYASDLLTTQENSSTPLRTTSSKEEYAMFSLASFVNYDFEGRYFASASVRQDGASRFGEDKRKGLFWSGSMGWNISKEAFLADIKFISDMKLSLSYGTLGSWNIPNYASKGYYGFGAYNSQTAAVIRTNVANPDLTWEKQKSMNIGVESSFLEKRISMAIDYFKNTRSDFLFNNPLTWEMGGYTQYINAGEMVTKGFEFSVNGDIIRSGDFKWNVGFNASFLNYEIEKLNNQSQIVLNSICVLKSGETPFTFYLNRYAGVDPANGDALYYDKDGNITNVYNSGDAVVLSGKSPLPKVYGGFNTYLMYKGFDLAADFAFKTGNYVMNYMRSNRQADGMDLYSNMDTDALNYWKQAGDENVLPRLNSNSSQTSTRFLDKASYVRFRSLTLGYTLPKSWIAKAKINRIRLFIQAQNLYTWTKFKGDPEVAIGSGENQIGATLDFVPGLYNLYSYPALKQFTFGVDIKF
ncbi:MAG: SusC/RagA family TonB-linked outer membrane protein [Tenuifilaceae bacterium]